MTIRKPQAPNSPPPHIKSAVKDLDTKAIGDLGEQLVSQWLLAKNCQVLHRQWHSRFGEIDLIAKGQSGQGKLRCQTLAFIEVKVRSKGNWDADGLLSITRSKQKKLRLTARYFLVRHPQLSEMPCRFDVALVSCHPTCDLNSSQNRPVLPIPNSNRSLMLQTYIRDAF